MSILKYLMINIIKNIVINENINYHVQNNLVRTIQGYVHRSYSEGIGMSPRLKDKRYHREYYISSSSKIKEQEAKIFYSNNEYSLDKKDNTQIG